MRLNQYSQNQSLSFGIKAQKLSPTKIKVYLGPDDLGKYKKPLYLEPRKRSTLPFKEKIHTFAKAWKKEAGSIFNKFKAARENLKKHVSHEVILSLENIYVGSKDIAKKDIVFQKKPLGADIYLLKNKTWDNFFDQIAKNKQVKKIALKMKNAANDLESNYVKS